MKKIPMSYYMNVEDLPVVAASKEGFFREAGIEIMPFFERPSSRRVAALADGTIKFATGIGNRVTRVINPNAYSPEERADFKVVCVTMFFEQVPLASHPNFNSLEDLFNFKSITGKKAKVSINGFNCVDHLILEKRFIDAGYGIDKIREAIEFIEIPSSKGRVAAMLERPFGCLLDAGLLHSPYSFVANKVGFKTLLKEDQERQPFYLTPQKGLVVTSGYLKENPAEVEEVMRVIFRALDWINLQPASVLKKKIIEWFEYGKLAEKANEDYMNIHGTAADQPFSADIISNYAHDYMMGRWNLSGVAPRESMALMSKLMTISGVPPEPELFTDFSIAEKIRLEKN